MDTDHSESGTLTHNSGTFQISDITVSGGTQQAETLEGKESCKQSLLHTEPTAHHILQLAASATDFVCKKKEVKNVRRNISEVTVPDNDQNNSCSKLETGFTRLGECRGSIVFISPGGESLDVAADSERSEINLEIHITSIKALSNQLRITCQKLSISGIEREQLSEIIIGLENSVCVLEVEINRREGEYEDRIKQEVKSNMCLRTEVERLQKYKSCEEVSGDKAKTLEHLWRRIDELETEKNALESVVVNLKYALKESEMVCDRVRTLYEHDYPLKFREKTKELESYEKRLLGMEKHLLGRLHRSNTGTGEQVEGNKKIEIHSNIKKGGSELQEKYQQLCEGKDEQIDLLRNQVSVLTNKVQHLEDYKKTSDKKIYKMSRGIKQMETDNKVINLELQQELNKAERRKQEAEELKMKQRNHKIMLQKLEGRCELLELESIKQMKEVHQLQNKNNILHHRLETLEQSESKWLQRLQDSIFTEVGGGEGGYSKSKRDIEDKINNIISEYSKLSKDNKRQVELIQQLKAEEETAIFHKDAKEQIIRDLEFRLSKMKTENTCLREENTRVISKHTTLLENMATVTEKCKNTEENISECNKMSDLNDAHYVSKQKVSILMPQIMDTKVEPGNCEVTKKSLFKLSADLRQEINRLHEMRWESDNRYKHHVTTLKEILYDTESSLAMRIKTCTNLNLTLREQQQLLRSVLKSNKHLKVNINAALNIQGRLKKEIADKQNEIEDMKIEYKLLHDEKFKLNRQMDERVQEYEEIISGLHAEGHANKEDLIKFQNMFEEEVQEKNKLSIQLNTLQLVYDETKETCGDLETKVSSIKEAYNQEQGSTEKTIKELENCAMEMDQEKQNMMSDLQGKCHLIKTLQEENSALRDKVKKVQEQLVNMENNLIHKESYNKKLEKQVETINIEVNEKNDQVRRLQVVRQEQEHALLQINEETKGMRQRISIQKKDIIKLGKDVDKLENDNELLAHEIIELQEKIKLDNELHQNQLKIKEEEMLILIEEKTVLTTRIQTLEIDSEELTNCIYEEREKHNIVQQEYREESKRMEYDGNAKQKQIQELIQQLQSKSEELDVINKSNEPITELQQQIEGQLQLISKLRDKQQKDQITINDLQKKLKVQANKITDLKGEKEKFMGVIEQQKEQLNHNSNAFLKRLTSAEGKRDEIAKKVQEYEKQVTNGEAMQQELRMEVESYKENIIKEEQKTKDVEKELEKYKRDFVLHKEEMKNVMGQLEEEYKKRLEIEEGKRREMKREREVLEKRLVRKDENMEATRKELQEYQNKLSKTEATVAEMRRDIEEYRERQKTEARNKEMITREKDDIKKLMAKTEEDKMIEMQKYQQMLCENEERTKQLQFEFENCKQRLDAEHEEKERIKSEMTDLKKIMEIEEREKENMNIEIEKCKKRSLINDEKLQMLHHYKKRLDIMEEENKGMEEKTKEINQRYEEQKEENKELKNMLEISQIERKTIGKKIDELRTESVEKEAVLSQKGKSLEELQKTFNEANMQLEVQNREINEARKKLDIVEFEMNIVSNKLVQKTEALREQREEIAHLKSLKGMDATEKSLYEERLMEKQRECEKLHQEVEKLGNAYMEEMSIVRDRLGREMHEIQEQAEKEKADYLNKMTSVEGELVKSRQKLMETEQRLSRVKEDVRDEFEEMRETYMREFAKPGHSAGVECDRKRVEELEKEITKLRQQIQSQNDTDKSKVCEDHGMMDEIMKKYSENYLLKEELECMREEKKKLVKENKTLRQASGMGARDYGSDLGHGDIAASGSVCLAEEKDVEIAALREEVSVLQNEITDLHGQLRQASGDAMMEGVGDGGAGGSSGRESRGSSHGPLSQVSSVWTSASMRRRWEDKEKSSSSSGSSVTLAQWPPAPPRSKSLLGRMELRVACGSLMPSPGALTMQRH